MGMRRHPGLLRGGFLDRIDEFEAEFFGISPREVAVMTRSSATCSS
jgi:acyl transferase domain-containing protein